MSVEGAPSSRCAGFTILEATVVMLVVGVLSVMVVQSLRSLSMAQSFAEGQAEISSLAQRATQALLRDARFAERVFSQDPASEVVLAAMDPATLKLSSGGRMPVPQELGYFEPDGAGSVQTGNVLFMVCAQKPAVFDVLVADLSSRVRVDRFRFVGWYLSEGRDELFDLNRWVSVPLARYLDIASLVDAETRRQVCLRLRVDGVHFSWDPDGTGLGAFRWIAENGDLLSIGGVGAPARIPCDREESRLGLFGEKGAGVAPNGFSNPVRTPFYAQQQVGFPHGFEVKVDGLGAGRLLLVRLTLTTNRPGRLRNCSSVTRLTTVRGG